MYGRHEGWWRWEDCRPCSFQCSCCLSFVYRCMHGDPMWVEGDGQGDALCDRCFRDLDNGYRWDRWSQRPFQCSECRERAWMDADAEAARLVKMMRFAVRFLRAFGPFSKKLLTLTTDYFLPVPVYVPHLRMYLLWGAFQPLDSVPVSALECMREKVLIRNPKRRKVELSEKRRERRRRYTKHI